MSKAKQIEVRLTRLLKNLDEVNQALDNSPENAPNTVRLLFHRSELQRRVSSLAVKRRHHAL